MTRPEQHDLGELSAHALGLLGETQTRAVDTHLRSCAACRHEWAELRGTAAMLDDVPPEMFLDGPPDGDLVLRRTLRQIRAEKSTQQRRGRTRRIGLAVAAGVTAVALVGGGATISTAFGPDTQAFPDSTTVSGSINLQGTQGPVSMTTTLIPASGWVRLAASVRGIPAGENCTLVVIGEDGTESPGGSWLTGEAGGTTLNGSAIIDPAEITAVAVRNDRGVEYITLPV